MIAWAGSANVTSPHLRGEVEIRATLEFRMRGILCHPCSSREPLSFVVPANAGTHSHRPLLLQKVSRRIFLTRHHAVWVPARRPGRREMRLRIQPLSPRASLARLDPVKNGERESAIAARLPELIQPNAWKAL